MTGASAAITLLVASVALRRYSSFITVQLEFFLPDFSFKGSLESDELGYRVVKILVRSRGSLGYLYRYVEDRLKAGHEKHDLRKSFVFFL